MKLRSYVVLTSVAVAFVLTLTLTSIAEDKATDKKPSAEEVEMMKKWEAIATPGPAHKNLDPLVGEWSIVSKVWMSPDQPPMETKGTTTTRWILGGRYLQDDFQGEFMGKAMKGMGITGYDNFKKKYISFWIDEGSTGMYTSEGDASEDGKVLTFMGKMDDVVSGEKDKPTKMTIRIVSANKHIFEMFDLSKGKDSKCMEMVYTKK